MSDYPMTLTDVAIEQASHARETGMITMVAVINDLLWCIRWEKLMRLP